MKIAFAVIALVGLGLDLATKTWAHAVVPPRGEHVVIPGWFSIGNASNEGIVWSFGPGAKTLWLVLAIVAVPGIVAYWAFRGPKTWSGTLTLAMVAAGAAGNAYDRIVHGAVRDFIMCYYTYADGTRSIWPLFNLADSFIVVGAILLAFLPSRPAAARSAATASGAPTAAASSEGRRSPPDAASPPPPAP